MMTTERVVTPSQRITNLVYQLLKEEGIKMPLYSAVMRRIKALLEETRDSAMVEYVCLQLAREHGRQFSAAYSLNAGSVEYAIMAAGVPDGAWKYALWLSQERNATVRASIEYWLGGWQDGDGLVAKRQLEKLWKTYHTAHEEVV